MRTAQVQVFRDQSQDSWWRCAGIVIYPALRKALSETSLDISLTDGIDGC